MDSLHACRQRAAHSLVLAAFCIFGTSLLISCADPNPYYAIVSITWTDAPSINPGTHKCYLVISESWKRYYSSPTTDQIFELTPNVTPSVVFLTADGVRMDGHVFYDVDGDGKYTEGTDIAAGAYGATFESYVPSVIYAKY